MVYIHIYEALLVSPDQALVSWKDTNGEPHSRNFTSGWGLHLARTVCAEPELWEASVEASLDIRGWLEWLEKDCETRFRPDLTHQGHTCLVVIRSIMSD